MDAASSIEELRPQILQNTLQQISLLPAGDCCIICLDNLVEQCEAQPCQHNNFDYLCLLTWLQARATCPLCKREVREVRYGLGEDGKYGKVYKVPERSEGRGKPNSQAEEDLRDSVSRRRGSLTNTTTRAQQQLYGEGAIEKRRSVYRHKLYSLHVGSNKKQPEASRYRELSPELFMTDPELVSRARIWLQRELCIFEFLHADSELPGSSHDQNIARRRRPSKAEFLLEYIIAILQSMDIQGSAGEAEDMIQDFLGRENTRLLLHEHRSWLRSPYVSLSAWDRAVQYRRV
ncbi:hypothetical protein F5B20DRAFT_520572 [Whalleya microplaca]|nr:hypothetical protein F5B20DRAFT_520572 [Whalleya microplaca]